MNKKLILSALFSLIILAPLSMHAASTTLQYSPPFIEGIPGFENVSNAPLSTETPIQVYLVRIYQFAIGISGVTAVGMMIWGGVLMSVNVASIDKYNEGKTMIRDALWGLALLFGSYLILRTINPELVQLKEPGGESLPVMNSPTSTVAQTCNTLSSIPVFPAISATQDTDGTCQYKRHKLSQEMRISSNTFYNGPLTLPAGSIVWTWPYYGSSENASEAKCIIYAQKKPPYDEGQTFDPLGNPIPSGTVITPSTEMVNLNINSLHRCPTSNTPQKPGVSLNSEQTTITHAIDVSGINISNLAGPETASCLPEASAPEGIIADIKDGLNPYVCSSDCKSSGVLCRRTDVTLAQNTINTILALQQGVAEGKVSGFIVTSLTGGPHSGPNDPHYQGRAMDVEIQPKGSVAEWNKALTYLRGLDGIVVDQTRCEYNTSTGVKFVNSCDGAFDAGATNQHIHITVR